MKISVLAAAAACSLVSLAGVSNVCAQGGGGGGGGGNEDFLTKAQSFIQTSATGPTASLFPYLFSITSTVAKVTVPGAGTLTLAASGSGGYQFSEAFAAKSAMDAAFPSGTYSFVGSTTVTTTIGSDLYPSAIPAVAGGGTWSNGVLVVDPTVSTVLQFSNFATYASSGVAGHEEFIADSTEDSSVNVDQSVLSLQVTGGPTYSAAPFTTYTFPVGMLKAGGVYQCALKFDALQSVDTTSLPGGFLGTIFSNEMLFYVVGKPTTAAPVPVITQEPGNQTGVLGGSVTFNFNFNSNAGAQSTAVIWFFNGMPVEVDNVKYAYSGGGLVINNLTASDAGNYLVKVVTPGGLVTSNEVALTLQAAAAPTIQTQPASATVNNGTVVFFLAASGGGLNYQWSLNGTPISTTSNPTANGPRLVISGAGSANKGTYTCTVSNPAGSVTSSPATLTISTVSPGSVSRLLNESVLTNVPTGTTLQVGFQVGGQATSGQLPVLARGDGPVLAAAPFNLTGTMADPRITIVTQAGGTTVASNDNWGTNAAAVMAADSATGAFPLTSTSSLDAALVTNLGAAGYTLQLTSNTAGGLSLGEIYDDTTNYNGGTPRLINLSTLANVPAGGSLSAGFILGGSTSRTVLIRADGPALASLGVTGVMPDPQLTLVYQSTGGQIAVNVGWGGNSTLAAVMNQVGAFALPTGSADSALLATLSPGINYTATATSASGSSGNVIIEVYEVP